MNGQPRDPDPLEELIATLRSDPRPTEIVDEISVVDGMLAALPPTEATNVTKISSRASRIAIGVAASVLGISGLAAAGGGSILPSTSKAPIEQAPPLSRPPVDTPAADRHGSSTTTSLVEQTVESTESTESTEAAALVDDPATAFDETQCADGNHGKTVSSVAQSVEPGPDHGPAVAEAAQSSCGKGTGDRTSTASTVAESDDEQETTSTSTDDEVRGREDAPGRSGDTGHGQGKGKADEAPVGD